MDSCQRSIALAAGAALFGGTNVRVHHARE
jgi:hypothetical protein